jgi:LPS-assembly lipoprotein
MWWPLKNRRWALGIKHWVVIACCLMPNAFLTACGFHPMYGDESIQSSSTPLRGNLVIDKIDSTHSGQILKTALEDRFNPEGMKNTQPEYHLQIIYRQSSTPSVVRNDGTILRSQLRLESTFYLYRTGVAQPVFTSTVRRIGSYNNIPNQNFATYEAEQDTTERLLTELAEDYALRISGYFAGLPHPQEGAQ